MDSPNRLLVPFEISGIREGKGRILNGRRGDLVGFRDKETHRVLLYSELIDRRINPDYINTLRTHMFVLILT